MWREIKEAYYEAGGTRPVICIGHVMGNVFKGMCWGVGFGIAFRLMGVL